MFVRKGKYLLLACILALCVGCTKQSDSKEEIKSNDSSLSKEEIYQIEDENKFLNELDIYLTSKVNNNIDNLNEAEKNLYLTLGWKKEKELGLYSYFISEQGYYYQDTIKALQILGAYYDAEILETASKEIELSKDIEKRKDEIKNNNYKVIWDQLDERLKESYDDMDEKCYYYALQQEEMMK